MKYGYSKGFTLVELIVVITIVGILATVGFVSYSNYLTGARDSTRISHLVKITDSLQVYSTARSLPLPDNAINITASGIIIGYQGNLGMNVLETLDYNGGGVDPRDKDFYTYFTTSDRGAMQLMAFMEDATSSLSLLYTTHATDYTNRFPKVYGKKLGILISNVDATKNTPAHSLGLMSIDIVNGTGNYISYLTDSEQISGTGLVLRQLIPNGSCKRIKQIGKGIKNGVYKINPAGAGEFQVYCDMETDGGGWTLVTRTLAGGTAHRLTENSVGILVSPDQSSVAKLSHINIWNIGGNVTYETRFTFDKFSENIYHQWNNGYSGKFLTTLPVSGGQNYIQTRKVGNVWINESIPYILGCIAATGPFSSNIPCSPIWDFGGGATVCHTGFGIRANCANPWITNKIEDINHRSGALWIK